MAYTAEVPGAAVGDCFPLTLVYNKQITTSDITGADKRTLPFAVRCRNVEGFCQVIGGSTVHTDVDLIVLAGSTTLATLAVVNSSTRATTPTTASVSAANQSIASGTTISFNIDQTGGSSPTADGFSVTLWCERA